MLTLELCYMWQQFEAVLQAFDEGKPVDLSKMPPSPGHSGVFAG